MIELKPYNYENRLRKAKEDIGYTGKVKKRKADNYCPGCGQALDWSSENE